MATSPTRKDRKGPKEAAIFDLDRTLLPGSSGTLFQKHLAEQGLGVRFKVPVLPDLLARVYETFGEDPITMQAARFAPRASKGWAVDAVHKAAEAAADDLEEELYPFARILIEDHHAAGRTLVMATTSPRILVQPLAERLGFDAVVATEWAEEDGVLAGRIEGPFVWGRGKLEAVKAWAADNGIDLRNCYFYSDSYFDAPLLSAVGKPVAANPDPRLAALAALRGWPTRNLDVAEGIVKIAGREIQEWLRPFARPELVPNARFEFEGIENIPKEGPAIVVFNHRSYFDATCAILAVARAGRNVRGLGKKEVFAAPVIGQLMRASGAIPVNRGTGSDEPLIAAVTALRGGEVVMMAPQGTIPRGPAFFDPVLKGRWGAARLAQRTKAPVIPLGLWGTEMVWPRNARFPKMAIGPAAPRVRVKAGPAVTLHHDDLDADTARIMEAIVDQLPPEAREHRVPTEEDLARTYPAGYKGDPNSEANRRPGTDT